MIFRDQVTGLEYIRNNQEMCDQGLYVELDAYTYHVFLDFRQVRDNDSAPVCPVGRLAQWPGRPQHGRGVARGFPAAHSPSLQRIGERRLFPAAIWYAASRNPTAF